MIMEGEEGHVDIYMFFLSFFLSSHGHFFLFRFVLVYALF
jgi:hypothetical protein